MLRRLSWMAPCFGTLLVGLSVAGLARGQTLAEGKAALDDKHNEYYSSSHKGLIRPLFKGERIFRPGDKDLAEAVVVAAKYAVYRFTWKSDFQKEPGKIDNLYRQFESDLLLLDKGMPNTKPVAQAYGKEIVKCGMEVLHYDAPPTAQVNAAPIAKINVARVMARSAELGQPELADALVELVLDPKMNDGVKYYACKGLHDLLALPRRVPPVLGGARKKKVVDALVTFLEQNRKFPESASTEEVDGFRILRREGVRALAQVTNPALGTKAPAALVLLRFVGADPSIQPPPRIDERLEAAIGVAHMRPEEESDYQADYAAYHIGRFLVDFARQLNTDLVKLAPKTEEGKAGPRAIRPFRPWRVDAARMRKALDVLKGTSKDPYVVRALPQFHTLLRRAQEGALPNPGDLNNWLLNNQPPGKSLFKGKPEATVQTGKPAEPGK
jgi:hypothetical protein